MSKVAERITGTSNARQVINEDNPDKVKRRTMSARNHMMKLAQTAESFNLDSDDRSAIWEKISPAIATMEKVFGPKKAATTPTDGVKKS